MNETPTLAQVATGRRSLSGRVQLDLDWVDGFQVVVALELRAVSLTKQLASLAERRAGLGIERPSDDERFVAEALAQVQRTLAQFHAVLSRPAPMTESEARLMDGNR